MADPTMSSPTKSLPSTSLSADQANATNISFSQALAEPSNIDIISAAQHGDVQTIRELIESGKAKATDRDPQNITPLHWAAINAHSAACRYLLEQGADVDARGGDLDATPLQWAARNGYLYIVQLLIAHNADPTIVDAQGYNTLHLVTHSSSVMPLLYLLHQPISVDSRDTIEHTALMWAAYQGDALSVDLLLKHGANPNLQDDVGLTPLHWAVVKANRLCIRRLIEKGADLNAKDAEGRTPRDMAVELKSLGAWKRALEEGGLTENGEKKRKPLNERNSKIVIFILPTVFFFLIFSTLTILPWYTGIILAFAEFMGMHHIVTHVLLGDTMYTESLVNQSPYFAGVVMGSVVWVVYCWVTRLVHQTQSHPFSHLLFALCIGLCVYNFFRAVTLDPGTCPKPTSDAELKSIIEDLASEGRLNGQTFCIQCMAKRPLRSKHCRACDRCIARHDHHCPWVWNCVGANNHRQFILFVVTLVFGIILFDTLTFAYFKSIPLSDPTSQAPSSCIFPDNICRATTADPFLFSVAAWITLQLVWTVVLLLSQLWQIAKQMTTLEVSNLGRYGFMGGRGASANMNMQMGHQSHRRGFGLHALDVDDDGPGLGAGPDFASLSPSPGPGAAHRYPSHHQHHDPRVSRGMCAGCGSGFLMRLLGFDRFTHGRAVDGLARAGRAMNPFDLGIVGNCRDFWSKGRELGVEYERLYEVPPEGFVEARRRREREENDDSGRYGKRGTGKGLLLTMGRSLGIGSSRDGYEPVSQV